MQMSSSRTSTLPRIQSSTPPSSPLSSSVATPLSTPPSSPASCHEKDQSDAPNKLGDLAKPPHCLVVFGKPELWEEMITWIDKPRDFLSLALTWKRRSEQTILAMYRYCPVPWTALLRLLFRSPKIHGDQKPSSDDYWHFLSRASRVRDVTHDTIDGAFPGGWNETALDSALSAIGSLPVKKGYHRPTPFGKVTSFRGRVNHNNSLSDLAVPIRYCLSSGRKLDRISIKMLSGKVEEVPMPVDLPDIPGFWSYARNSRAIHLEGIAFRGVPARRLKEIFSSATLETISLKSCKREGSVTGTMQAIADNTAVTDLHIETGSQMAEKPAREIRFSALKKFKIYAASISSSVFKHVFAPEVEKLDISVEEASLGHDTICAIRDRFPKRRFFHLCQRDTCQSRSLDAILACSLLTGLLVTSSRYEKKGCDVARADLEKWEERGYLKNIAYFDLEYEDHIGPAFKDMAIPVTTALAVEDLAVLARAAPKLTSFTLGLKLGSDTSSAMVALGGLPEFANCLGINLLLEITQAIFDDAMEVFSRAEPSTSIIAYVFSPIFRSLAEKLPALDLEDTAVWVRNVDDAHGLQNVSDLFIDEYSRLYRGY